MSQTKVETTLGSIVGFPKVVPKSYKLLIEKSQIV